MLKSCCFLAVIFAEIWMWKLGKIPSVFPPQRWSVSWLTQWNTAAQKQEASDPPRFNLFTNMGSQRLKCCIVLVSNDSLTPNLIHMVYFWWAGFPESRVQNNGTFKFHLQTSWGRRQRAAEWSFSGEITWNWAFGSGAKLQTDQLESPLQFTKTGGLVVLIELQRSSQACCYVPVWSLWCGEVQLC